MKNFTLFLMLALSLPALTQNLDLKRTYVVSGGVYSNPADHVAVGYYEPGEAEYHVFDSIYTQSGQDVISDDDMLFVAAGDSLISYNMQTHERIEAVAHTGLNKMALSGNKLIVTRQYPVTTESVLILDKLSLELSTTLTLSGEAAGIHVEGDSAYIAVPGAWGTSEGHLAVVDLNSETLAREINLGAEAKGTKEVFYRNSNLYIVNTHFSDYENNTLSVTEYNIYSGEFETNIIEGDYYGYYGNSVMAEDHLLIPVSSSIARYNVFSHETQLDFMDESPAAMAYDVAENHVHLTRSDYSTYGEYQIFDLEGDALSAAMECGISPESMCLSYDITNEFLTEDVLFWVGEGSKEALLVIDWNDGNSPESMAWGYRFESAADAETMLLEIAEADAFLEVETAGGFLNDIVYNGTSVFHSGIGGAPDYWSTWNRTSESLWEMNMGISADLSDGMRFGCSYGFDPEPQAPDVPAAAPLMPASASDLPDTQLSVWMTNNQLYLTSDTDILSVEVYNTQGQLLLSRQTNIGRAGSLGIQKMSTGLLLVKVSTHAGSIVKKVIR